MMTFDVIFLSIIAVVAILLLRDKQPTIAFLIGIGTSILILVYCLPKLQTLFHLISNISAKVGVDNALFETLIKCIGIAYVIEFASDTCKDAGQSALSSKILLCGKITLLAIAFPLLKEIIDVIISIIE